MAAVSDLIALDSAPLSGGLAPRALRLETDTFCEHCNYNLFGQEVTRDERLQIPICRCPECGRFHAAGRGVSASRVWLNRFGTSMLAAWVLFCIGFVSIACIVMGSMEFAYLERFTIYIQQTPDGQDVYRDYQKGTYIISGTTEVAPIVVRRRITRDSWDGYNYVGNQMPLWQKLLPFCIGSLIPSISIGILFSVAFWHLKRRAFGVMVVPILVSGFVFSIWRTEIGVEYIIPWSMGHIALWMLFDLAMMAVGLVFGRRIARLIVSIMIPPKPRQHFAFLWSADGKAWPFAQAAGAAVS